VPSEEIGEHLENVVSSSLSTDLDRQTLPRVLVEHGQKLQRTAVMDPRASGWPSSVFPARIFAVIAMARNT
jgi:hypothetical protein